MKNIFNMLHFAFAWPYHNCFNQLWKRNSTYFEKSLFLKLYSKTHTYICLCHTMSCIIMFLAGHYITDAHFPHFCITRFKRNPLHVWREKMLVCQDAGISKTLWKTIFHSQTIPACHSHINTFNLDGQIWFVSCGQISIRFEYIVQKHWTMTGVMNIKTINLEIVTALWKWDFTVTQALFSEHSHSSLLNKHATASQWS